MDPAIPISLSIGFALRVFLLAFDRQSQLRPAFLGIWEGIAVYHALGSSNESQLTAYFPCALRLTFDFLFTENLRAMTTMLFSFLLAVLMADALGSHRGHDTQSTHRSDVHHRPSGTHTTQVYEIIESHRSRRARVATFPFANRHTDESNPRPHASVVEKVSYAQSSHVPNSHVEFHDSSAPGPVLTAQNADSVDQANNVPLPTPHVEPHDSPSPGSVHVILTQLPVLNPITPPCTPPQHSLSGYMSRDPDPASDSESHQDELRTPPSLAVVRDISLRSDIDNVAVDHASVAGDSPRDEDELQTPLALDLRDLPPIVDSLAAEQSQPEDEARPLLLGNIALLDESPVMADGVDLLGADGDNVSELSLQTGTELSIISDHNALKITAKAELLRRQAWDAQKQKPRLEQELSLAVSQGKVKDAFLLRLEIDAVEERAKQMHGRAARRHFRARNLSQKDGVIDVHGLFVPEAIERVKLALHAAILDGRPDVRVIVGRGLHSRDGRPKLRPEIMREMERQSIPCRIQTDNPGVLILTVPS